MHHFFAPIRFNIFGFALRAPVIAAAAPDISPFFTVIRTTIVIDELPFRHCFLLA
jgi:hypothetical protein